MFWSQVDVDELGGDGYLCYVTEPTSSLQSDEARDWGGKEINFRYENIIAHRVGGNLFQEGIVELAMQREQ